MYNTSMFVNTVKHSSKIQVLILQTGNFFNIYLYLLSLFYKNSKLVTFFVSYSHSVWAVNQQDKSQSCF